MAVCKSLYVLCLEFCIPRIETHVGKSEKGANDGGKYFENLAGPVLEDMLNYAFHRTNNSNKSKIWKKEWKIFFTSKMTSAIISWDADLIEHIGQRCLNLRQCEVVLAESFDPKLVLKLPPTLAVVDFDGELIRRGQKTSALMFEETTTESWLPQAERILKALQILRSTPPDLSTPDTTNLSYLHLGTARASASDLKLILSNLPNIQLLRHYQLTTALYELHSDAWKSKSRLPKYKLTNLDVDFSHVVRCRMSPEWVLSPDALQLAILLCPSASSIRVRFDCSTPHDVLSPLVHLFEIKEFSAVCVSSGERTLLDFSDMKPILEKHGKTSLDFLELKVIEEVEIHAIIDQCTRLEGLILSGCGFVSPANCESFSCRKSKRGSFNRLRCLFYADGDDFSWDHGVPECFWKATLLPSGAGKRIRLKGLFLENPKMVESLVREIFRPGKLPFPEMEVLSLCRFGEITVEDIASVCGLNEPSPCQSLKYVRLSDCERITGPEGKRLNRWLKQCKVKLRIDVDR